MSGLPRSTRGRRISRWVGSMLSNASFVACGYIWAAHGVLWALALYAVIAVVFLALWGALQFPWKDTFRAR